MERDFRANWRIRWPMFSHRLLVGELVGQPFSTPCSSSGWCLGNQELQSLRQLRAHSGGSCPYGSGIAPDRNVLQRITSLSISSEFKDSFSVLADTGTPR